MHATALSGGRGCPAAAPYNAHMRATPERLSVTGWILVLAFSISTAGAAGPDRGPKLSDADWDRLRAGEVILQEQAEEAREVGASVSILVHARVESVWAVIVSCEQARAFVAGLEECTVLEERGDYALTRQVVDKGWATPRLEYRFETRRVPYESMAFRLVDGNLRTLLGSWSFQPGDAGLLVRHSVQIEPLVPAPRWLVRRNLRQDLPGMMRCIRALAGGSGDAATEKRDLQDCSGDAARMPAQSGTDQ